MKIVMYHYIRPLKRSRFPEIKGRDLQEFKFQLNYLRKNFHIATPKEIFDLLQSGSLLPDDWVLLTFDDGYIDHFRYVFPLLHDYNLSGMFFPPQVVVEERELLDVNKIHFFLNSGKSTHEIYQKLRKYLIEYDYSDERMTELENKYLHASRFDGPEIMFIKNILQKGIPLHHRKMIATKLFKEFVSIDEKAFSEELYLSLEECKLMARMGMFFGSHGKNHYWMNEISDLEQEIEIRESLDFLHRIHNESTAIITNYVMCYPFGSYNDYTLELLKKYNFSLAFTTQVGDADFANENRYKLKRFDTNDFPIC